MSWREIAWDKAAGAADFNQDGVDDIVPASGCFSKRLVGKRNLLCIFFTPQGGFGPIDLSVNPPPHLRDCWFHATTNSGVSRTLYVT